MQTMQVCCADKDENRNESFEKVKNFEIFTIPLSWCTESQNLGSQTASTSVEAHDQASCVGSNASSYMTDSFLPFQALPYIIRLFHILCQ